MLTCELREILYIIVRKSSLFFLMHLDFHTNPFWGLICPSMFSKVGKVVLVPAKYKMQILMSTNVKY